MTYLVMTLGLLHDACREICMMHRRWNRGGGGGGGLGDV